MCAAYIAQQQGIGLDTAIKKVSDPIGDLWFLLAEFARDGCAGSADLNGPAALTPRNTEFVTGSAIRGSSPLLRSEQLFEQSNFPYRVSVGLSRVGFLEAYGVEGNAVTANA
jgi:hypothetical protein